MSISSANARKWNVILILQSRLYVPLPSFFVFLSCLSSSELVNVCILEILCCLQSQFHSIIPKLKCHREIPYKLWASSIQVQNWKLKVRTRILQRKEIWTTYLLLCVSCPCLGFPHRRGHVLLPKDVGRPKVIFWSSWGFASWASAGNYWG